MFPPNRAWFERNRKRAKMLPHIEVSRQEFIRLFIESGGDPEKAQMQAMVSEGLGSYAMIGDKMVKSLGENEQPVQ